MHPATKAVFVAAIVQTINVKWPNAGSYAIPSIDLDLSKRKLWATASFRKCMRMLKTLHDAGRKTELGVMETLVGFRFNENSWLTDSSLNIDIMQIFMYDWMHVARERGCLGAGDPRV